MTYFELAPPGIVRLNANKIKGYKSLRLFNHLPIVHPNVYQPQVHQQTSRHFSCFKDDG